MAVVHLFVDCGHAIGIPETSMAMVSTKENGGLAHRHSPDRIR
jgi:hypothetical protein